MTTKEIGEWGETAACEYLEEKDYEIIRRNFRVKCGEIDIIAMDEECTVFVEVKTRQNNLFGEPSEYVNYHKQQKLIRAANCFIDTVNSQIRFDIVEVFYRMVDGVPRIWKINHIENAF